MANAKVEGVVFNSSEPCVGTFLNLVTPRRVSQSNNETPTFSANFELAADSKDLPRLRAAIADAARELFPGLNLGAAIADGSFVVPIANGDMLADKAMGKARMSAQPGTPDDQLKKLREWSRGKHVLTSRSKEDYAPALTLVQNGKVVALEDKDARKAAERANFYSGQRVLFGVRLKAYEAVGQGGKPGVKAYLEAVHSCGGGEKLLGGGSDPTERFREYIGQDTQVDPTGAAQTNEW